MDIARPLGRLEPTDWNHVEKYPLRTAVLNAIPQKPTPVVLGINWYQSFDSPQWDEGKKIWIIGRDHNHLGLIRGGHAVCLEPGKTIDPTSWWSFYDQGSEGACVGFAASRAMSLMNRMRYDARWLYHEAQKIDEWEGENYSGTSVRAAMDILRDSGHCTIRSGKRGQILPIHGIEANRWATTVYEIRECLQNSKADRLGMVPILNSWGRDYPHIVWMPDETLDRVLDEYGEATLFTDR